MGTKGAACLVLRHPSWVGKMFHYQEACNLFTALLQRNITNPWNEVGARPRGNFRERWRSIPVNTALTIHHPLVNSVPRVSLLFLPWSNKGGREERPWERGCSLVCPSSVSSYNESLFFSSKHQTEVSLHADVSEDRLPLEQRLPLVWK